MKITQSPAAARALRRRAGFTLVELLVVIGIIVVLISVLMPVVQRAKASASQIGCISNLGQLCKANLMYANDSSGILTFPNWGDTQWYGNAPSGWLYRGALTATSPESIVETGNFWQYVNNRAAYKCPAHAALDHPTFGYASSDRITSFLMNGAVCSYGATTSEGVIYHRLLEFKGTDIVLWEADEHGGAAWNDGSSYPGESYNFNEPGAAGLSSRHGHFASIGFFDGHAEIMSHEVWNNLVYTGGRNALWCAP